MRSYLPFIAANPRFLTFGVLATLFSSFGQTFFIALFGGAWREAFDLSHGDVGAIYSGATLVSGLTLMWLGRLIDRVALWRYTLAVCLALSGACLLTGLVPSAAMLAIAFFTLRLTGQGLLSHLAMVAMARRFVATRGKAVSLAAVGHPVGEAVFPLVAVVLMAALGWRGAWLLFGAVLMVGLAPLMLWLLRGAERDRGNGATATKGMAVQAGNPGDRSLKQVVRDPLFFAVMFCMLAPAFITTGLFFHQVALAEAKGWSLSWLASCFIGFAATQTLGGLGTGTLVDRFGAVRVLPMYLLPLAAACAVVASFDHPLTAAVYLGLAGVTAGAGMTLLGALWAEVYGVAHLGAIRGLVQAMMVLATAAAPGLLGWLLDGGIGFSAIGLGCAGYAAGASALLTVLRASLLKRIQAA
ncbi:MFS transporter [Ferruginivarius sediminum]|uniref:MFS transporter n=1 Tax=Ferruginivarius sediminum TaxID=2661937 RepID=A0A369TAX1_9PROT|nr:MFS transporter [Ferruginivarius sediminum]RDD62022.1 MFS transporter [Ferruginivarius sediminum]